MKSLLTLMVAVLLATPVMAQTSAEGASPQLILQELNRARMDPPAYAQELRAIRRFFDGKLYDPGGESIPIMTNEGLVAVDEAIAYLERQAPMTVLTLAEPLNRAALSHAREQERTGRLGHNSEDGTTFSQRISREGSWQGAAAENISYGMNSAVEVVRQLIIDDGVPDRGHRGNIFNPNLRNVGAGCATHLTYRHVCVMDFVTSVIERPR